jgi:urea carboxylase
VLDAMKTEISVPSHVAGVVEAVHCELKAVVDAGQLLLTIRPAQVIVTSRRPNPPRV